MAFIEYFSFACRNYLLYCHIQQQYILIIYPQHYWLDIYSRTHHCKPITLNALTNQVKECVRDVQVHYKQMKE